MARTKHTTYSVTDDLAGVTVAEDDSAEGGSVSASQAVYVTLTQGETVYRVDTSQGSPIAALLRKRGVKQGRKGRKSKQA